MKLTAITIRGIYEVECDACGRVVDVTSTYAKAIQGRREHHKAMHPDDPPAPRPPRAPTGRGTCAGCGRNRAVLANGVVIAHDLPATRRRLNRLERRQGVNPIVRHGRCPGSHNPPTTTPTEEATP